MLNMKALSLFISLPTTKLPRLNQRRHFFRDDFFAAGDFFQALLHVIVGNHLEVVHVVEVDVVQLVHGGVDVARHSDINKQERPVFASPHQRRERGAIQDMMRRRRAADGDIDTLKLLRPVLERQRAPTQFLREGLGTVGRTVRDGDFRHTAGLGRARSFHWFHRRQPRALRVARDC